MKKKRNILLKTAFAALSLTAILGGCKKDDFVQVDGVCPIVQSTDPANMATRVALNKVITVTFNEKMNPATITNASITISGASAVSGIVTYSGNTATFIPSSPLVVNTTYTGKVTTAVKDETGNALQADYIWTFTTGSSVFPTVISTDPVNNASDIPLNKTVTSTFNMSMDPSTMNATTFTVRQGTSPAVTGTVTYTGSTASFKSTAAFATNTVYTVTITTGAKNLAGTALAANYVWTFTTGTSLAPTVISTDPLDNAVSVPLNKVIVVTFSTPMDPLTVNFTTFTLSRAGTPVAGTVTYSGSTASFTPSSNLLINTDYTATITTGAKNTAGIPLANNYVWRFSTNSVIGSGPINLNSVARFGIIAGVGVSNNAGFSEIHNLDVGIYPGVRSSVTGFPPAIIVNGAIYASDDTAPPGTAAMLLQAKTDLTNAYLAAEGAVSPAPVIVSGDQGGKTLAPGIYKSTSTLLIQSGNLTLDAQGDVNATWIFQIAAGFTTVGGAGGSVILTGGAQAKNIYWQTGSSAVIGDYTSFQGNILALTSITMNSHATAVGRMLARNGSVVMTHTNIIIKP